MATTPRHGVRMLRRLLSSSALRIHERSILSLSRTPAHRGRGAAISSRPARTAAPFHTSVPRTHIHSSSVSDSEVSHFTALASSWWDAHGPSRLLHLMNPVRHDFIRECQASSSSAPSTTTQRGLFYLDIGCGGGVFAESAARLPHVAHVTGLDPTPAVLAIARQHALQDPGLKGKLDYLQGSVESFLESTSSVASQQQQQQPSGSGSDSGAAVATTAATAAAGAAAGNEKGEAKKPNDRRQFDLVSIFEVLEHVNNPKEFLAYCLRLVKPGGWLVGSTIARTPVSYLTTKLVAEDLLRIVPRGTHEWSKYVNEDEVRHWLGQSHGWGDVRVAGVVYVPGLGWKRAAGSEKLGNYFFAVQRLYE